MKKGLKILSFIVGLGLVLLILGGIILKFYFTEARLRSLLLPPVRTALGREVEISSIGIDLLRGIKIGGLVVKEDDGKTDFVVVKELGLNYSWRSLLERRLEIGRIWLDKPTINVWRNRDGTFNFSSLRVLQPDAGSSSSDSHAKDKPQAVKSDKSMPLALVVQRCDISGASVTFVDKAGTLPKMDMTADITTKLDLGDLKPESIRFAGKLDFKLLAEYQDLTPAAEGTIKFTRQQVDYDINLQQKDEKCTVSGSVSNYLGAVPALVFNLDSQRLDLAYLAGLGEQLAGGEKPAARKKVVKSGSPEKSAAPPQLTAKGKIDIKELVYENYKVDDFLLGYDYAEGRLAFNDVKGRLAEGAFSGKSVVKPFLKQPEFSGDLSFSALQVSGLTAMAKPELKDKLYGVGSGDIKFSGRGASSEVLRRNLSLDANYVLQKSGLRNLPLTQALSQLLGLSELKDLQLDKLDGNLRIEQGQLKLNSRWHGEQLSGSAVGNIGLDGGLALPVDLILSRGLSDKLVRRYAWVKEACNDKGEAELSIYLDGSVSEPKLKLNRGKVTQHLQKKLEKKLFQKLDERLGAKKPKSAGKSKSDNPKDLLHNLLR